ncbi:unnamed protein product [Ascophyllum nodosum]
MVSSFVVLAGVRKLRQLGLDSPLLDEEHQERKKSGVSMWEGLIKIVQSEPLTGVPVAYFQYFFRTMMHSRSYLLEADAA